MTAPATTPTIRPAKTHRLKIWPGDFEAVRTGMKTADIRRCDDRDFRRGDILELDEWNPNAKDGEQYTGRRLRVVVTHIDRMAGPRMLCAVGNVGADDVVPLAVLSFRDERRK